MAATRLIALHVNKGKTIARCLADRTDYSENAAKTNDGEYISSYECDPKSCDQEFLLAKRKYLQIRGFDYQHNVIAYQIRQSFRPGEITPEEANRIGYETAMSWTKGHHAFMKYTQRETRRGILSLGSFLKRNAVTLQILCISRMEKLLLKTRRDSARRIISLSEN